MLKLRDFFRLPQIDRAVQRLVSDRSGLVIVAGLDQRQETSPSSRVGFLPSGRPSIFNTLLDEILEAHPSTRCMIVTTDKPAIRIPRSAWRRVNWAVVEPPYSYSYRIQEAAERQPDLLVVDRLSQETVRAVIEASQKGRCVLTQLDTVFYGPGVLHHLIDLGVPQESLGSLSWVFSVHRLATLCAACKQPGDPSPAQVERLQYLLEQLDLPAESPAAGWVNEMRRSAQNSDLPAFYRAKGCQDCHFTGRQGDVAVCDIYHPQEENTGLPCPSSLIPLQVCLLHQVTLGQLALDDVLNFETEQLHHTFNLLVAREEALVKTKMTLENKLAELESANRVLTQRTRALVTLQDIGRALIASNDLADLADRVCRHACELCGADRAILYLFNSTDQAEILAATGWQEAPLRQPFPGQMLPDARDGADPISFNLWPPGVPPPGPTAKEISLRAGLCIPLVAQHQRVGLMIIHASQKTYFAPGEVALLQTFAIQAALALQRAGLIEELRGKIAQLEAAQVELAVKERMERELELARQVQQSVLPRAFPSLPGFQFAVRNQPARQVGGDFYDVFQLGREHFGLAVADVSGKGMPAALYMTLARSLLLAEARRGGSPREVLEAVNQLLLELGESGMFVTVFYGVVDRSQRVMRFARAGHDRPLLLRKGSIRELGGDGIPLGIYNREDLRLTEEEVSLEPGDRMVLYTDGLVDVESTSGELFDRQRLLSLVRSFIALEPDRLCEAIFLELARFQAQAEQYDDMTLLVVDIQ